MDQAGGVGGLLMATISNTNCFAAYDGNGNITALINAVDNSIAASYEYSPYGEPIRETGLLARQMPFRFSTKFWDEESGLIYYNYRFYSPTLGKWISRDMTGENGGVNLSVFLANSPLNTIDTDGNRPFWAEMLCTFEVILKTATMDDSMLNAMKVGLEQMPKAQQIAKDAQATRAAVERAGASGGPLGEAEGIAASIVATEFLTSGAIMVAGWQDVLGAASSNDDYVAAFYRDCKSGNTAYADLDAALAAYQLSQGSMYAGLDADAALEVLWYAEGIIGN